MPVFSSFASIVIVVNPRSSMVYVLVGLPYKSYICSVAEVMFNGKFKLIVVAWLNGLG